MNASINKIKNNKQFFIVSIFTFIYFFNTYCLIIHTTINPIKVPYAAPIIPYFFIKIKFKKILTSAPIPVEKNNTFVFIRVRKIDAKNADILENTDANNKYGINVQPM